MDYDNLACKKLLKVNHLKIVPLVAYYVKCLNYVAHWFIRITNKAAYHYFNSFRMYRKIHKAIE